MLLLGAASIGIFAEKNKRIKWFRSILFFIVLAVPIILPVIGGDVIFWNITAISYALFFIFIEILRHLIKPSYINADIISAAACGYFLLIKIDVFVSFFIFNNMHDAYEGVDTQNHRTCFLGPGLF